MRNLYVWSFFAGLYYGLGIHTLTDVSIAITYSISTTQRLFQPCHYMGNSILASSIVYTLYPQWKNVFRLDDGANPQFEWSMRPFSFLWMGFGFANAFVYPTEFICGIYSNTFTYTLDRLLLAAPCGIVLYCFAELWGWNRTFRTELLRA